MLIKGKLSQIASTFTWFIGFVIIFFLMFFFLIVSLGMAAQKIFVGKIGGVELIGKESSLILNKELFYLLKTKVELEGTKISVLNLIKAISSEDVAQKLKYSKALREEMFNFFKMNNAKCYAFRLTTEPEQSVYFDLFSTHYTPLRGTVPIEQSIPVHNKLVIVTYYFGEC